MRTLNGQAQKQHYRPHRGCNIQKQHSSQFPLQHVPHTCFIIILYYIFHNSPFYISENRLNVYNRSKIVLLISIQFQIIVLDLNLYSFTFLTNHNEPGYYFPVANLCFFIHINIHSFILHSAILRIIYRNIYKNFSFCAEYVILYTHT